MSMAIHVRELPSTKVHVLGTNSGYFPAVATTDGRHVVIVHRAGAGHMGRSGRLDAVISEDGGDSWSQPVTVADSEWDDRDPEVGVAPSGEVLVAYHVDRNYTSEERGYEATHFDQEVRLTRSRNGGRTWEAPYSLNIQECRCLFPYGQMVTMPDGTLLMGLNGSMSWAHGQDGPSHCHLARSRDGGTTWEALGVVAQEAIEPAFLPLKDGGLLAVVRSQRDGNLYCCSGHLPSSTWTEPVQVTTKGRIPPSLVRLSGGAILMAYGVRIGPSGARGLISTDEGETWPVEREIIFGDNATNWDCGYANALVLPSGRLIVAYYTTAQEDPWRCDGAHLHVVVCDEKEMLDAIGL